MVTINTQGPCLVGGMGDVGALRALHPQVFRIPFNGTSYSGIQL